jgi:hypothetical protein
MKPVLLSQSDLKLGVIAAIAVSPDGQRAYLGRRKSGDPARQNLAVLSINPADGSVSSPRLYRDSELPLPLKATFPSDKGVTATVSNILIDPRYRKLYLTSQYEIDPRLRPSRHLTVYDLDRNGEPIGEPRSYEVGKVVNGTVVPSIVAVVNAMTFHPTLNRLYMVGFGWHGVRYYDLNAEGEPQADSYGFTEIPTLNGAGKFSIAVSPDGKRLYLGSITSKPLEQLPADDLQIVELNAAGVPQVETLKTFSSNAFEPGKSTADYLKFIYTPQALYRVPRELPDGASKSAWPLLVWPLNPTTGLPVGNGFQLIDALQQSALAIDPTRQTAWIAQDGMVQDAFSGALISDRTLPIPIPLDGRGLPLLDRVPKVKPAFLQEGLLAAIATDTGMPVFLTQAIPQTINYHKNYHVRITALEAESIASPTPNTLKYSLTTYNPVPPIFNIALGSLSLNQPSPWQNLDTLLRDRPNQTLLIVTAQGSALKHLKLQIEIVLGDPSTTTPIHALTETVVGNQALFLLPGYRFHLERDRTTAIESLSQHTHQYLQAAQSVALKPEERPQQFIVSCTQCIGGQGHLEQLQAQVAALKALGFNTGMVYTWGNLSPAQINQVLDADPEHRFHQSSGLYNPLAGPPLHLKPLLPYFDFIYDGSLTYNNIPITADTPDQWATTLANLAQNTNGMASKTLVSMALSDEPGWVYPLMLDLLSSTPNLDGFTLPNAPKFQWVDTGPQPNQKFLQRFRDYLSQQGLTPADVGQEDWSQVYAIGAQTATPTDPEGQPIADISLRRLFYWTIRFFAEAASKGHAIAQAALQKAFGSQLQVFVNWNNWVNQWYFPAPNQQVFNYPANGPDTAGASFDWFTSGRLNAHTLWSEDEFRDWHAQIWSFYGNVLHSAASHGDRTFGGYVRAYGNRVGDHPAGASYKILSLIGHGAKTVNLYSFGTAFLFGNCWSEQFESYAPIAEAIQLVGRSERVLFPGKPVPGHVAIFLPNASRLWEDQTRAPYYLTEIQYLHFALIHAGYRVEFVDDLDIAQGMLTTRKYTTLYLTGPNVSAAAQAQIKPWVEAGGTLTVMPGGGVADEYNEPSMLLDEVLGVMPGSRKAVRAIADGNLNRPPSFTLHMSDSSLLELMGSQTPIALPLRDLYQLALQPDKSLKAVLGPAFTPLNPKSASVVAGLLPLGGSDTSQPAITLNSYGQGRAIAYSFFPGWQYWNTPLHPANPPEGPIYTDRLPRQWGRTERQLAVLPALLANAPKAVVVSHEVVEVCRLESEQGIALVILNWTDEPIQTLSIEVPKAQRYTKVSSAKGNRISSQLIGQDTLRIQLPIEDVDVVLIE